MDRRRSEDGAVAVLVAICMVIFVGFGALAIDIGSARYERRDLVATVDAAALAAAESYATNDATCNPTDGWGSVAGAQSWSLVTANAADAQQADFTYTAECVGGNAGKVTISGRQEAVQTFSGAAGVDDLAAGARSVAQFGNVTAARGLRPFGLCGRPDPMSPAPGGAYQEWLAAGGDPDDSTYSALKGVDYPSTPQFDHPNGDYPNASYVVHRIDFRDPGDSACNLTGVKDAGNWGWIDYDGKGTNVPNPDCSKGGGANQLGCSIEQGYPGVVDLGDPAAGAPPICDETTGSAVCPSETGSTTGVKSDLAAMRCTDTTAACADAGKIMTILAYDEVSGGAGAGFRYDPLAFVGVILRGYSGDGTNPGNIFTGKPGIDDYMDVEFVDLVLRGRIGGPGVGSPGVRGYELCGADYDEVDDRCSF